MATSNTTWELPFGAPADLELHAEWGSLLLVPVEAGEQPRLELTRGTPETVAVLVEKDGDTVRVAIEPQRGFNWLSGWECRATLYVPRDIRASVQTSAGTINARDLAGCEDEPAGNRTLAVRADRFRCVAGGDEIHGQKSPSIVPLGCTRIASAAGVLDRPGIVMMSPARATTKPAPADTYASRTVSR